MLITKRKLKVKKKVFIANSSQLVQILNWPLALIVIFGCDVQVTWRVPINPF
jgi:hypothetical protein